MTDLVKQAARSWSEDQVPMLGAALAYYMVFSIAPLLVITVAVAGLWLGGDAARGELASSLSGLLGPDTAATIQGLVERAGPRGAGLLASVIGVVTLLLGASGFFGQLQAALNRVWGVRPPKGSWKSLLRKRLPSFLMVFSIALLLLASLALSAALSGAQQLLGPVLPGGELPWRLLEIGASLAVQTLLFATIFKALPDTLIRWSDVWLGALLTSLLFTVGKVLIGLYLGRLGAVSAYGAAGSVVALLVWVYSSSQIALYGAELTKAYAHGRGSRSSGGAETEPGRDAKRAA